MGFLGRPHGFFSLNENDKNIGSYISIDDICVLFNVTRADLANIKFINANNTMYADELLVHTAWNNGKINNAPSVIVNNFKTSLDELILIKIIKKIYPTAIIKHQVKWGRKSIDLIVTVNGLSKLIEFHGPHHFVVTKNEMPANPFDRKKQAEQYFNTECIIWPYWIHKCERNVRAIFEKNISGIGAIWSANVQFSEFCFQNSAEVIHYISSRFNSSRNNGYGYFYESGIEGIVKPEHPIISKIRNGSAKKEVLLPKGYHNAAVWLPESIINT